MGINFFQITIKGLNLREIYKYTPKSVKKTVYLKVFLGVLIISLVFKSKTAYNNYLRTEKFRPHKFFTPLRKD